MRIIGGTLGRRRLNTAGLKDARPSSDRTRESLFAVLENLDCLDGAAVLDLFAGSGALGIEALSRGAARATFVERRRGNADILRKNLTELELNDRTDVLTMDVLRALRRLEPETIDLAFCDPPYALGLTNQVMDTLAQTRILRPDGLFVAEHGRNEVAMGGAGWTLEVRRVFGETHVDIYRFGFRNTGATGEQQA